MSRWSFKAVWAGEVVALASKLLLITLTVLGGEVGEQCQVFNLTVLILREAPLPSVPQAFGTWGIHVSWMQSFSRSGTSEAFPVPLWVVVCCSIRQGNLASYCCSRVYLDLQEQVCAGTVVVFSSVRGFLWCRVPAEACCILSGKGDCPFIAEPVQTCWCLWSLWKQRPRFEGWGPMQVGRTVLRC